MAPATKPGDSLPAAPCPWPRRLVACGGACALRPCAGGVGLTKALEVYHAPAAAATRQLVRAMVSRNCLRCADWTIGRGDAL